MEIIKYIYILPTHLQPFTKYPQATCFGHLGPSLGLTYEQVPLILVHFGILKIKGTRSYVRPDDGPRGPKHVACGYFVKDCRCVGRMCIYFMIIMEHIGTSKGEKKIERQQISINYFSRFYCICWSCDYLFFDFCAVCWLDGPKFRCNTLPPSSVWLNWIPNDNKEENMSVIYDSSFSISAPSVG